MIVVWLEIFHFDSGEFLFSTNELCTVLVDVLNVFYSSKRNLIEQNVFHFSHRLGFLVRIKMNAVHPFENHS